MHILPIWCYLEFSTLSFWEFCRKGSHINATLVLVTSQPFSIQLVHATEGGPWLAAFIHEMLLFGFWMERVVGGAAARKKLASSAEEQEEAKKHFEQSWSGYPESWAMCTFHPRKLLSGRRYRKSKVIFSRSIVSADEWMKRHESSYIYICICWRRVVWWHGCFVWVLPPGFFCVNLVYMWWRKLFNILSGFGYSMLW